jgi:transcription factor SFP1
MSTSPQRSHQSSNISSPSRHKVEASFLRDFRCCGKSLATLHDLREHYDTCHAQFAGVQNPSAEPLENLESPQGDLGNAMLAEAETISP